THDNGAAWSPSLLDASLADTPGALAAAPRSGRQLALLTDGTAELSATGGTHWARLATLQSLARSAAGRRCGLQSLSAAAFSPSPDARSAGGGNRRPPPHCWPLRVPRRGVAPGRPGAPRLPARPAHPGARPDRGRP